MNTYFLNGKLYYMNSKGIVVPLRKEKIKLAKPVGQFVPERNIWK